MSYRHFKDAGELCGQIIHDLGNAGDRLALVAHNLRRGMPDFSAETAVGAEELARTLKKLGDEVYALRGRVFDSRAGVTAEMRRARASEE